MIWLFIIAATVLSYLFCKKDCTRPEYYIVMLFPIEMYGISVASATIKPYMILGIVIVIQYFVHARKAATRPVILAFAFLMLLSDILTGLQFASIMQHLMVLLNMLIVSSVLDLSGDDIDLFSLANVSIATVIGHGLVFLACTMMLRINSGFPGILATNRNDVGVFLQLTSGITQEIRMRGFTIDPNGFVVNYLLGGGCAIYYLFTKEGSRKKNIIAVVLFALIVIESGSRMGMVCFLVLFILGFMYANRLNGMSATGMILFGIASMSMVGVIVLRFDLISSIFNSFFTGRATVTSSDGRFTIWRSNWDYLISSNKIWLGVGQGQIASAGSFGHAFHNTWLEWISGCGIFIGGAIDLWFLKILFSEMTHLNRYLRYLPSATPYVLCYAGTVLCLTTISNIANITYIFLTFLLTYHLRNQRMRAAENES
ncbi:MAG: O-antigen ligase family protein [Fastidiosipila sp.]|nr:O-antigen ligase family protein [Fastidiosipila sp.]